jgi:hypothetical protein
MQIKTKWKLPVRNGTLTDADFVGDAPPIGSSDAKYTDKDNAELMKLAEQLKKVKS